MVYQDVWIPASQGHMQKSDTGDKDTKAISGYLIRPHLLTEPRKQNQKFWINQERKLLGCRFAAECLCIFLPCLFLQTWDWEHGMCSRYTMGLTLKKPWPFWLHFLHLSFFSSSSHFYRHHVYRDKSSLSSLDSELMWTLGAYIATKYHHGKNICFII